MKTETLVKEVRQARIGDLDEIITLQIFQNNAMAEAECKAKKLFTKEDLRQQIGHGLPLIVAQKGHKINGFLIAESKQSQFLVVNNFYTQDPEFEKVLLPLFKELIWFCQLERFEKEILVFETKYANKFSITDILELSGFKKSDVNCKYGEAKYTQKAYKKRV